MVAAVTRILLVRHGESKVTVAGVIGGYRTCSGLTDLGRRQTEALRDRWLAHRPFTPDVLIASNFARARETAEILAPALDALPVLEEAGFGEHDPGPEIDGMSFDDFNARFGDQREGWREANPFAVTFPGGETLATFHHRVGTALQAVLDARPDGTVVVVCHGGTVGLVLRIALKAPPLGLFEAYSQNTSITEVEWLPGNRWLIHRYNDAAHLDALG
jgi:2,3-bisphosphoglycerate-dependent phosphoglycerate mutase